MKKEIEKVETMYKKLESMKSELLFVSNEKLTILPACKLSTHSSDLKKFSNLISSFDITPFEM